jgi:type I restriction enzyme R subunit
VFDHRRFLDLVRHFIVIEDPATGVLAKKVAGYQQFQATSCSSPRWLTRRTGATSS